MFSNKNIFAISVYTHEHSKYILNITVEILDNDKGCVMFWDCTTPEGKNLPMSIRCVDGGWANSHQYLKPEEVMSFYTLVVETFNNKVGLRSSGNNNNNNNLVQDLLASGFKRPKNWVQRLFTGRDH